MWVRTGLTDAEADRAAWTVDEAEAGGAAVGGVKVGGARAIGLALSVGRDAAWPTLPWKLPVVPWALDRIYDVIARNRHRLPGQTPWCEAHPDRCSPSAP